MNVGSSRLSQYLLLVKLKPHIKMSHMFACVGIPQSGVEYEKGCFLRCCAPPLPLLLLLQEKLLISGGAGVNTPPAQGIADDGSPKTWIQNLTFLGFLLLTPFWHLSCLDDQSCDWNQNFNFRKACHAGFSSQSNLGSICKKTECVETNLDLRFGVFLTKSRSLLARRHHICRGKMSPRNWYDGQHASPTFAVCAMYTV